MKEILIGIVGFFTGMIATIVGKEFLDSIDRWGDEDKEIGG